MKEKQKKIIIVICVLVIFVGIYTLVKPYGLVTYVADSSFDYVQQEDGIVLTQYTGTNKNIIIPAEIDGKRVVALGSAFHGNNIIENVVISEGIETIDYMAFWHCINLLSVEIPDSVTTVGHAAFSSCISLKKVKGGSEIIRIMPYAFEKCISLEGIAFSDSLTFIGEKAFERCENLKAVEIPASVEIIGGKTLKQETDDKGNAIIPEDQRGATENPVFDGCSELKITVHKDNSYYYSEDNIIKSKTEE